MVERSKPVPLVSYLVQVARSHDVGSVAAQLREAGLEVHRELPSIGVISGSGHKVILDRLRKVPGVKLVREEGSYSLPPFDEGVPQ